MLVEAVAEGRLPHAPWKGRAGTLTCMEYAASRLKFLCLRTDATRSATLVPLLAMAQAFRRVGAVGGWKFRSTWCWVGSLAALSSDSPACPCTDHMPIAPRAGCGHVSISSCSRITSHFDSAARVQPCKLSSLNPPSKLGAGACALGMNAQPLGLWV